MKYEIRNRWTGAVQFTAEIECAADASERTKLGLAVRAAVSARAYLSGTDLRDAYLAGADLRDAYLAGADLRDAYLAGTYLSGADLAGADLVRADLTGAYLAGAYLVRADLTCADLASADLVRADLTGAYLAGANLARANLAGAKIRDGIAITRAPISVHGLAWDVVIYDHHMQIGCEFHTHDEWRGFSRKDWIRMGGKAAAHLLERHFPALDFLCAVHAKADQTDAAEAEATAS